MNQTNEQLEMMGELLQQLIHRLTSLEEKIAALSEQKQQENLGELNTLNEELARFKRDFNDVAERLIYQTQILADRTAKIPKEIPVQHQHLFDRWAKGFIISTTVMFVFTAFSIGGCMNLWSENKLLHANDLKFRMIRLVYPSTAVWADSIYYHGPANAELVTEQQEEKAIALQQAEALAKQKEQEAKEAKEKAKTLKKGRIKKF